jgi:uridylate kinase
MYKRIVLKLSGEVLAGPRGFGLDAGKVAEITGEIVDVHSLGVEIGVVVGGGNIFRGVAQPRSSTPSPCKTPWNSAASSAA